MNIINSQRRKLLQYGFGNTNWVQLMQRNGLSRLTMQAKDLLSALWIQCALMVSESLTAIGAESDVIIDGPFSKNGAFLAVLACLHPNQAARVADQPLAQSVR